MPGPPPVLEDEITNCSEPEEVVEMVDSEDDDELTSVRAAHIVRALTNRMILLIGHTDIQCWAHSQSTVTGPLNRSG